MKLAKVQHRDGRIGAALVDGKRLLSWPTSGEPGQLTRILDAADPAETVRRLAESATVTTLGSIPLAAPIDRQEVWAAGVTYRRSQVARMEESRGAASFYDQVYVADRPELFFKATPHRVSGPGVPVRIRRDARWNVPEPELALVLNSRLELVGYTIGNDMSSRDIEGANPLYLPQAKVYDGSCGLGPWITLASDMPSLDDIEITLLVARGGRPVFQGTTSASQMARSFDDLIQWLGRDNSFPDGVMLLTGTGIVPGDDFTLSPDDVVEISIRGIGTLSNPVVQAATC
jgi:2-dehydro-3-deoxy-D-arabinonate dehydratase